MKTHESDVKEEEEEEKKNGRVKQLLPSQFPVQSLLLDYTNTHLTHTHSSVFGGGAIGQQRERERRVSSQPRRSDHPKCDKLIELPFLFFWSTSAGK